MLSGERRIRLPCFAMEKRDGGYHESVILLFGFCNYGYCGRGFLVVYSDFCTGGDHMEDISKDQIRL